MSSDDNRLPLPYAERLTDFESRLRSTMDDRSLQQDVYRIIRSLLSDHKDSESDIRKILLARFERGELREETFRLVQGMLDRIVTEDLDTLAGAPDSAPAAFADTDVLPVTAGESENPGDMLQVGSVLRDRFLLQRRIAGGSMGVVYRALDRRLAEANGEKPWVAIKVLTPQLARNAAALRALQQEAAKGRCLSHPNIVRVIDLDRDEDQYFIVMEWLEGRSLASILDDPKTEKMDVETALEVVRQVGNALDYAHRCGVVHADVKPGNIMVTPDGNVKLIDFGVARVQQKQRENNAADRDAGIFRAATPAYSSMQVLTGEDPVPADDVFSLGCLLYRLVAGYRVFGPRNAAEAAAAGMQPERPAALNEGQWKALKKALAYARVARYPSPKAFLDDLDATPRGTPRQPMRAVEEDTISTPVVRPTTRSWSSLIGVLALAGVAGLVLLQPERFDPLLARALDLLESSPALVPATAVESERPSDVNSPAVGQTESAAFDEAVSVGGDAKAPRPDGSPDVVSSSDPQTESLPPPEVSGERVRAEVEPDRPADSATGASEPEVLPVVADDTGREPAAATASIPPEETGQPSAADRRSAGQDFMRLPPATHELTLGAPGKTPPELVVRLRENSDPAIIDFYRDGNLRVPLTARVSEDEETFATRSAWESGQYELSDDGMLEFAAGYDVARLQISMTPDPLREPDREITLLIRDFAEPDVVLGVLLVTLEDDDQRAFETQLAPNTVAFAVSQVSAREGDRAVQIDLIRFRPDALPLTVEFVIEDITATEGLDYFAPGITELTFEPNQRAARLLIPLVQDTTNEPDEAFLIELPGTPVELDSDIFRRIAVMIRDDDP